MQPAINDLPHWRLRKPKKTVPHRHAVMLVVVDGREVLLQQRPDSGIWGGLLSLLELDGFSDDAPAAGTPAQRVAQADAITRLLAPVGTVTTQERLQPFAHAFTHFKLTVAPLRIALSHRSAVLPGEGLVWVDVARLADAPLPSPIKKLLLSLFRPDDLFAAA